MCNEHRATRANFLAALGDCFEPSSSGVLVARAVVERENEPLHESGASLAVEPQGIGYDFFGMGGHGRKDAGE